MNTFYPKTYFKVLILIKLLISILRTKNFVKINHTGSNIYQHFSIIISMDRLLLIILEIKLVWTQLLPKDTVSVSVYMACIMLVGDALRTYIVEYVGILRENNWFVFSSFHIIILHLLLPQKKAMMHAQKIERVNMLELKCAFLLSQENIPPNWGDEWMRKSKVQEHQILLAVVCGMWGYVCAFS